MIFPPMLPQSVIDTMRRPLTKDEAVKLAASHSTLLRRYKEQRAEGIAKAARIRELEAKVEKLQQLKTPAVREIVREAEKTLPMPDDVEGKRCEKLYPARYGDPKNCGCPSGRCFYRDTLARARAGLPLATMKQWKGR